MIKTGSIIKDGQLHQLIYERDETYKGLKYEIKDLTTNVTIWREPDGYWQQEAAGKAPLSQVTLQKVITEILANQ